jgi:NADH-quinone oxidoreductase subunit I
MSMALLKGLALTLKYFFRKPITLQYPEQKRPVPQRFRGRPALIFNPDGMPRCVACGLCEKICPSLCITVVPKTGTEGVRVLSDYTLDLNRCSFCGLCVEACPVEAIQMSHEYELAARSRQALVYVRRNLRVQPTWRDQPVNGGE